MSAPAGGAVTGAVVTILRHGNTFAPGEPPRRIGARTDVPLTAEGEAQAQAAGAAFRARGVRFDRVLASPLRRTRDTAALVLAGLAPPVPAPEPCAFLAEIDHGPDEDRPEAEVLARIGADALARWDAKLVAPPGWAVDAPARVAAWRALLGEVGEGAGVEVLAVTSNGAARFALHADAGLAAQAASLPSTRLRTGAWGRIVREGSAWRLDAWDVRA